MYCLKKNILFIAIIVAGFTTLTSSNLAFSEIYKWRDSSGVTQYSDKAPTSTGKTSRAEILNMLQTKELCREPESASIKKAAANYQTNFFGFNNPGGIGFMGQPAVRPSGLGNIGIGNLLNPTRPGAGAAPTNAVAARPPSWLGLPTRPLVAAAPPRNTAPSFVGLNPTSFFNIGNRPVTVFGRPFNLGAISQPKPVTTAPKPTPTPVAQTPAPTPTPTPAPTPISSEAQVFNLTYKAAPADNPLKGFMPYAGSYTFPHSMEWFYLPLKDLQTGYDTFNWTELEKRLNSIQARGHQATFRIYLDYPQSEYGVPAFLAHVPKYSYTDHGNKTSFSPDYTHPDLRRAVLNFIKAFGERYDKDPRIGYITAGFLGFWGEWHTYTEVSTVGNIPPKLMEEVSDAYNAAFPTKIILARGPIGGVDMNKYNRLGFHDDSFALSTLGPTNWHFWPKMINAGLKDSWKTRPMGGEVYPQIQGCIWDNSCTNPKNQSFSESVATTHATWMLNHGAFVGKYTGDKLQRSIEQAQSMGYSLHIPKANLEPVSFGQSLRGSLTIENRGVAPFYYPWTVQMAALDSAGNLRTWPMSWDLRTVLPGSPNTWNFNISNPGLASGSYTLMVGVTNPMAGGKALKFANTTQDQQRSDWLSLGTYVVKP